MCKVVDDMSHSQETEMNAHLGPWPMEWCCPHLGLPTSVKTLSEEMPSQTPTDICLLHNPKYHEVDSPH